MPLFQIHTFSDQRSYELHVHMAPRLQCNGARLQTNPAFHAFVQRFSRRFRLSLSPLLFFPCPMSTRKQPKTHPCIALAKKPTHCRALSSSSSSTAKVQLQCLTTVGCQFRVLILRSGSRRPRADRRNQLGRHRAGHTVYHCGESGELLRTLCMPLSPLPYMLVLNRVVRRQAFSFVSQSMD